MHSDDLKKLEQRIIALEEAVMHSERLLADLNEVICGVQERLDDQTRQLRALKLAFEREKAEGEEERSFEDERPPHY